MLDANTVHIQACLWDFLAIILFVARKSSHKFDSVEDANKVLIYNYNPVFTGKDGGYFEQTYLFPK